jgi:transcriptional regulator with XRE-family HTH domain
MGKVSVSKQLGDFLRQRREKLDPKKLAMPSKGKRRTPGLRREEVAERAGISVDWYVRLEQGRESLPSKTTVNALAQALVLTNAERAHLMKLAIGHSGREFKRESVPEHLKALVRSLTAPAYLLGVRYDILFWNQAAADVFGDFEAMPVAERNSLYQMFGNPNSKKKYLNWEADARRVLENFRSVYDLWSHAPEFNDLVEGLSFQSSEFRKWWNTHEVRRSTSGQKIIRHPAKGKVILEYSTFQSNDNPDLKLVLCNRI